MSCNKEKSEEKGKNECSKNICNNQKFTLVLILKFESGKTQKLKSQFKSKSSQGGCDLPNEKQFKRARKKLLDSWKKSQKLKENSKTDDKLTGIDTQISHSGSPSTKDCEFCQWFSKCGCWNQDEQCTSC